MLERAVEESRKQKRRGTPNVSVFAGMSLPDPLVMPLHMPKRHVRFLHAVHADARRASGLPPPTDADTKAKGKALIEGSEQGGDSGHGGTNGVKVEAAKDGAASVKEEGVCPSTSEAPQRRFAQESASCRTCSSASGPAQRHSCRYTVPRSSGAASVCGTASACVSMHFASSRQRLSRRRHAHEQWPIA